MMKKLIGSILVVTCLSCSVACSAEQGDLAGKRYNVLLIMAEDLSPRISSFGDALANTPNLDQLASEGVRYTNTFTTAPVCSTSRSSHIMGVHQQTLGTMHHRAGSFPEGGYEVITPVEVKAYPELLRAAGYHTTNTGKTDYQVGRPFTFWDVSSPKAHWENTPEGKPFFSMMTIQVTHESSVWPAVRESDDPQLKKQTAKNKALWDSKTFFTSPEDVIVPPYYPDTRTVREALARHYDNIHVMDARVGEILQELKSAGKLDDTLVIWTTDHGDGMPRGKRSLYDTGTKVPMIVRFPDDFGAGTENDEFVSFVDIAPTLLSVAGAQRPGWLQGRVFAGVDKQPEPEYIYTAADRFDAEYMSARAVRDKQYKYIRNADETQPYFVPLSYQDHSTIMQELWKGLEEGTLTPVQKANFVPKGKQELYDVKSDPWEVNNLANDPAYSETLARLRQASEDWTARIGDLGAMDEADFVRQMLPDGTKPETARVGFSIDGDKLLLESATEGASIGYQLVKEGKNNWSWELYTEPLMLSNLAGRTIQAKAIRYGFKVSDVTTWSAGE
ncbi:MAG: sulfatase-like hydrolase/transferase [Gammaproteobacteria bacterium]|nr:sulfatase-like hydrolase/transferase [Gammaproteobacteria bacterium]